MAKFRIFIERSDGHKSYLTWETRQRLMPYRRNLFVFRDNPSAAARIPRRKVAFMLRRAQGYLVKTLDGTLKPGTLAAEPV